MSAEEAIAAARAAVVYPVLPGDTAYYVTFGQQYPRELRPGDHWPASHRDGWLRIDVPYNDHNPGGLARAIVAQICGTSWSSMYPAEDFGDDSMAMYPLGQLAIAIATDRDGGYRWRLRAEKDPEPADG